MLSIREAGKIWNLNPKPLDTFRMLRYHRSSLAQIVERPLDNERSHVQIPVEEVNVSLFDHHEGKINYYRVQILFESTFVVSYIGSPYYLEAKRLFRIVLSSLV